MSAALLIVIVIIANCKARDVAVERIHETLVWSRPTCVRSASATPPPLNHSLPRAKNGGAFEYRVATSRTNRDLIRESAACARDSRFPRPGRATRRLIHVLTASQARREFPLARSRSNFARRLRERGFPPSAVDESYVVYVMCRATLLLPQAPLIHVLIDT